MAEFWRNWHVSLTSWFKDYLYIPLGGSRKGKFRKQVNRMIVFLVSGLWHGADMSYVVWGGLNGVYQVIGSPAWCMPPFIIYSLLFYHPFVNGESAATRQNLRVQTVNFHKGAGGNY